MLVVNTRVDQSSKSAGSDESVKQGADSAQNRSRNRLDYRAEFLAEGKQNRDYGGSSDYPEPTRVLRRGMTGADVKWLQAGLKKIGYTISVDGMFGTGTLNCVLAFQRSVGLTADGAVGPVTRAALKARI